MTSNCTYILAKATSHKMQKVLTLTDSMTTTISLLQPSRLLPFASLLFQPPSFVLRPSQDALCCRPVDMWAEPNRDAKRGYRDLVR